MRVLPILSSARSGTARSRGGSSTAMAMATSTILVGLNAALQKRFVLDATVRLIPGDVHRATRLTTGVGGKGQDVACTLHCLQYGESDDARTEVQLAQFIGTGAAGDDVYTLLDTLFHEGGSFDVTGALTIRTASPMRTCTSIVASDCTTELVEPSGIVATTEWNALRDALSTIPHSTTALCFMGSLPPGCPGDAYAQIYQTLTSSQSTTTIPLCLIDSVVGLDTLLPTLQGTSNILKINVSELHKLVEPTRKSSGALLKMQTDALDEATQTLAHDLRLFWDQYQWSTQPCPLQAIALTAGKDAAYLAWIDSTTTHMTLYRCAVADLAPFDTTLYPIGAGDAVAAGTLAAWHSLHDTNAQHLPIDMHHAVNEQRLDLDSIVLGDHDGDATPDISATMATRNEATCLAAFAFGLACGSASCLQEENSMVDRADVLRLLRTTPRPTRLTTLTW